MEVSAVFWLDITCRLLEGTWLKLSPICFLYMLLSSTVSGYFSLNCRCWLHVQYYSCIVAFKCIVLDKNELWLTLMMCNLPDCFFSSAKSTWEHIGICRSYGARSSPMWCASCSASVAGSTVSCPTSTALLDPPDLTRPVGWATRPSRVSAEPRVTPARVWSVTIVACLANRVFVWLEQVT